MVAKKQQQQSFTSLINQYLYTIISQKYVLTMSEINLHTIIELVNYYLKVANKIHKKIFFPFLNEKNPRT